MGGGERVSVRDVGTKPMQVGRVVASDSAVEILGERAPWRGMVLANVVAAIVVFVVLAMGLPAIPWRSGPMSPAAAGAIAGFTACWVLLVSLGGQAWRRGQVAEQEVILRLARDGEDVRAEFGGGVVSWRRGEARVAIDGANARAVRIGDGREDLVVSCSGVHGCPEAFLPHAERIVG